MKYVVAFSGGMSSSLAAIEAVRKVGKENVLLVNNNLSPEIEDNDIKRFKDDISNYLDIPITYANMDGWENKTPIKVCRELSAFKYANGMAICTSKLKTEPFRKWLSENYPADSDHVNKEATILYGFDITEPERIQRRSSIMATKGYRTDFPLAFWNRTISDTYEIGINKPRTYKILKHANCFGCLKAGIQHWYIVYCLRPVIFQEALDAENDIGYSIINGHYLQELIPRYEDMKKKGICPNDKENSAKFWAKVDKILPEQLSFLPCDCALL